MMKRINTILCGTAALTLLAGTMTLILGRPAGHTPTATDALMPEVVVTAQGPRLVLSEVVVRADRPSTAAETTTRADAANQDLRSY
jgi:hypothetical protein